MVDELLGGQADHPGPQAEGQVLGHEDDLVTFPLDVQGHHQDAMVVASPTPHGGRNEILGGVVELDPYRAPVIVDGERLGEPSVSLPDGLQPSECRSCRPAQLGVVALGLQFGEHDDGDDHVVVAERPQ